ncbi:RluA family pseudouridine synthase [Lederbergia lenta]|uniref:RluA family pseudouridine synthase n=1 Tax=Lederbergia lenta TaxID=1467 RepID=UPI00203F19DA|nr:RluA family pseudouridine synthase [Lederbergia lenta]MCM3110442.1 RluA family pseudouridine synthase [Lederbergia lenta]
MRRFSLKWQIENAVMKKDIKNFLAEEGISRRALADIKFAGGMIKVNGEEQTVRYELKASDVLEVSFPPEESSVHLKGEPIELAIVYEDRDMVVVNKPANMNSIPSKQHPTGSIANALVYYYEQTGVESAVHIVTRLDRNTSGLMLIAKHRHAHHLFSLMQRVHTINRTYESFVVGQMQKTAGTINAPIGRKPGSIIEREVRQDGKKAITHFELIHQYSDFAHLKLQLETGRTHQIRVHMNDLGHPLLGDDLYGGDLTTIERQALHCSQLQFKHPFTKKECMFKSTLPSDMKRMI